MMPNKYRCIVLDKFIGQQSIKKGPPYQSFGRANQTGNLGANAIILGLLSVETTPVSQGQLVADNYKGIVLILDVAKTINMDQFFSPIS